MSRALTIWLPAALVVVGALALVVVPPLGWLLVAVALAAASVTGRGNRHR
jgi:phosphotransferase system  glucose/maltose/N-acetylglucosamine-specific IIC component